MFRKVAKILYFTGLTALLLSVLAPSEWYQTTVVSPLLPALSSFAFLAIFIFGLVAIIFAARNIFGKIAFFSTVSVLLAISFVINPLFGNQIEADKSNLRVATVNLLWDNETGYVDIANSLEELGADIVFVQEYNDDVDKSNLLTDFPYHIRTSKEQDILADALILSKYKLTRENLVDLYDRKIPQGFITIDECTDVQLTSVHTLSPTTLNRAKGWVKDMEYLGNLDYYKNSIVGGDFNGNTGMQPYRLFMEKSKLVQKHGTFFTWGLIDGLKLLSIDHILSTSNIKISGGGAAAASGSDHSIVYVDFSIPLDECFA